MPNVKSTARNAPTTGINMIEETLTRLGEWLEKQFDKIVNKINF